MMMGGPWDAFEPGRPTGAFGARPPRSYYVVDQFLAAH